VTLLSGTSAERLALHVDPNCHEELVGDCEVKEDAKKGRARLLCRLRDTDRGRLWKIGRPKEFAGLPNQRAADWTFTIRHDDTHTTAHIMECKKTVKLKNLVDDVKPQWLGALRRVLALTAIAGIDVDDVVFYVVYQNDTILEDPVASKLPIGDGLTRQYRELIKQANEWRGVSPFEVPGVDPSHFVVRRVRLDTNPDDPDESVGSVTLDPRVS
jgi:hypothetical protein